MSYTFTVIVNKDCAPGKHNFADHTPLGFKVHTLKDFWAVTLDVDTLNNNYARHPYWRLATMISDISEDRWDDYCVHTKCVGTLQDDFQVITAWNLFVGRCATQDVYNNTPRSLHTVDFNNQVALNYPNIKLFRAPIMTGKQFKELYPGQKKRLFNQTRIHNGFKWKENEINTCIEFDGAITCGKGLYLVEADQIERWHYYNGQEMIWEADVEVLDDSIVAIEYSNDGTKYKASAVKIGPMTKVNWPQD